MSDARGAAAPFSPWERSIALRYLRARRSEGGVALIAIISFLGIMAAVFVLVTVMSVMNGFRSQLTGVILGFNGHAYVVGGADTPPQRPALLARLRAVPGVVEAVPIIESQALVQGPSAASGAIVRGVSPEDLRAMPLIAKNIKTGSIRGFGDGDDGGDAVLVGQKMAETLGVGPGDGVSITSPSGGETAFGTLPIRKTYTVAGVFSVGMSQYDEAYLYMPLKQAQLFFDRGDGVDFIEIKLDDPDKIAQIKPLIVQAAGPGTVVSDWTQKNQAYFGALQVEHNVMRLILMMLVLIAALNIISALVMLVKNKGKDIAILRTMGAGQGAILRIFFMCGAAVGALGALVGLVLGVLFCANIEAIQRFVEAVTGTQVFNADVYFLSRVPAKIDWSEVGFILVFAMAASFLATLWPAWTASRIDPVEALRYE